jgi:Holliday junction resolvase RusA-like endonuclease
MLFPITPMGAVRTPHAYRFSPTAKRYFDYKEELRQIALVASFVLPPLFIATFTLPMPPSWSIKKRAAMNGQPHTSKPDIDNLWKALTDALLADDQIAHTLVAKKVWGEVGAILIEPFPAPGTPILLTDPAATASAVPLALPVTLI